MRTGVIAKKMGLARFFDEDGVHVPVTVLSLDGCAVTAQRTEARDGYVALQLGAGLRKPKNTTKPLRGHFAKAEVEPRHKVAEFRVSPDNLIDVGAELTADHFVVGQKVDVRVTQYDRKSQRVTVSIKQLEVAEEKEAIAQYGSSDSGATLGDILGTALKRAGDKEKAEKEETE